MGHIMHVHATHAIYHCLESSCPPISTHGLHSEIINCRRCYFMLQDTSKLAEAEQRLKQARESLHRSYGPNLERMRVLHGNFTPELAL